VTLDITKLYNNPKAEFFKWIQSRERTRRSEMVFIRDEKVYFGPVPLTADRNILLNEYIDKHAGENEVNICNSFFYDGVTLNQKHTKYRVSSHWYTKEMSTLIEFDDEADLIEFRLLFQEYL
jgi:hypothetical protein